MESNITFWTSNRFEHNQTWTTYSSPLTNEHQINEIGVFSRETLWFITSLVIRDKVSQSKNTCYSLELLKPTELGQQGAFLIYSAEV